jgi:shikimate dehydrogenase
VNTPPERLVLLGHPVSHSLSPAFQNAALAAAGIPLRYEAVDVTPTALPLTLVHLVEERAGGNVTIPHKIAVARACKRLTPEATRVGAVNTFATRDGMLVGHNTDVAGVDRAARDLLGTTPRGLTIGLFGAGGAAAAVLAAVESWSDCAVLVANRDASRAATLCERFGTVARPSDVDEIAARSDLVVNATALGMARDEYGPVDPARLRPEAAVLDLVYGPNETALVRGARARGLQASDGLSMLVAQGAAAFAWWFGRDPDIEVMWRAVGRSRPGMS